VAVTFQFPDAAITTNPATVVPDGPTSRIVNQSDVDGLTGFASNAPAAILTLQGGRSLTTRDTFSNTGTLIIATDSTFTVTGAYTQPAGSTFLDGGALTATTVTIGADSTLSGSGTIMGDVMLAAKLYVGAPGVPGILASIGDYTQTGTLVIEISGTDPTNSDFDQLQISGQVTFAGGTLTINLINDVMPDPSHPDSFRIITFGARDSADHFAVYNGLGLGDGNYLAPIFDDGGLTLVATSGGGAPHGQHERGAAELATALDHLFSSLAEKRTS
jgi:hypothetical protein